jgi:RNA polymerase sigma-70 factor (ECF subfamily)
MIAAGTSARIDLADLAPPAARAETAWRLRLAFFPMDPPSKRPVMSPEAAARFRGMVDRDFAVVWRLLRGLGVAAGSVDDAAQQVFLIASQRIDAITAGSERAFLLATARGVAANVRRSQARSHEVPDESAVAEKVDDGANPEQALASRQARALLDSILDGLPEDAREVFVLFELEGMTMATIAETLGLPPGTVASRLRRAREEFHAASRRFQAAAHRGAAK